MKKKSALLELLKVMAVLRGPNGCPWDREQDHRSISEHAIEEVYEMVDAIEAGDDVELAEELGDLLLQIVFHCQLAAERGAFDFERVARHLVDKLIRRHPHVFGDVQVGSVDAVWAQWEQIKKKEKAGTRQERPSVLDGVPRHLPGLMRAQKLYKKARKASLAPTAANAGRSASTPKASGQSKGELARTLFALAEYAQDRGWSAEALLRGEIRSRERKWRQQERRLKRTAKP